MIIVTSILLGIAGTAVMTLFMYLISYITQRPLKVVKILGTMLTMETTPDKGLSDSNRAIRVGLIAHYLIGIIFAVIYVWLWKYELLEPTFAATILFGFIAGLIGIIVWRIAFDIHPNPPVIPLRLYLTDLLIGHLFFGLGIWGAFKLIILFIYS
jgi:hypothetical protein